MMDFDTIAAQGDGICAYEGALSFPIFQTSSYIGGGDYSYSRCSNPTRDALEREVALLEHGNHGFAFSSGLAAINSVFSLLSQGDRVVVSDDLYGGTYRLIGEIYRRYGISFVFTDTSDRRAVSAALRGGARMLLTESPTNPMMRIAPLRELAELCGRAGAVFVVDNTFLTPCFQNPLDLGADIVVHSSTKYISGHHDTVSGLAVVNDAKLAERLALISMTLGNALSPFDSWLTLRGLRTLPLRMKKHSETAQTVAEFLASHEAVDKVYFPGLPTHPGHGLCMEQAKGFGGVVSFSLRDSDRIGGMMNGGNLIRFAESLGGVCSLITHPLTQTHASIPERMRQRIGITDKLFRLSVGLEDANDIIRDIERMLESDKKSYSS